MPSFYPVIYGLDDGEDWNDEKAWYKANPSLGYTIQIDRVRDAHREALTNPAEENVFRQLRLDQWVGSAVAWIPEHIYDKGDIPIDTASLRGRECYCGLDLINTSWCRTSGSLVRRWICGYGGITFPTMSGRGKVSSM